MKKLKLCFVLLSTMFLMSACNKQPKIMQAAAEKPESTTIELQQTETTTAEEQTTETETSAETTTALQKETTTIAVTSPVTFKEPFSETAVTDTVAVTETATEAVQTVRVDGLNVSTISVSCLKVTWNGEQGRDYEVSVDTQAEYTENIYYLFKSNSLLYITGLRENSEYDITITPIIHENETAEPSTVTGHTEQVHVVYDFDANPESYAIYKDSGVLYATDFFAGEKAGGLTAQPSSGAIYGAINDPITDTGICRDEFGDYCAALGEYFGSTWDRYLIEFDNGQQITVKQCDSKGYRWYHPVGNDNSNRNIVEFIWYGSSAPSNVMYSGTWGYCNWNGLIMTQIRSIKKIDYPENIVEY